jgi:hypothetical protein
MLGTSPTSFMEEVEESKHKLGLHTRWSKIESLPNFYTSKTQLRPEVTDSIRYDFFVFILLWLVYCTLSIASINLKSLAVSSLNRRA